MHRGRTQRAGGWRSGEAGFGNAERLAALPLIERDTARSGATLGARKGYGSAEFVAELRERAITPHLAQNQRRRRSAIEGRLTRGYAIS